MDGLGPSAREVPGVRLVRGIVIHRHITTAGANNVMAKVILILFSDLFLTTPYSIKALNKEVNDASC